MSNGPAVSVVLPAYNEAATLAETVGVTLETLAGFLDDGEYEVIVAEDGCDDRTPEIASDLADREPAVRHLHSDERLGRGGALEYAFRRAEGETLVYFDTDLATDMGHLEPLLDSIRSEGYDVATGSRWLADSDADRPASRGIPSRGYNALVRVLLRSSLRDHQCGFKAFDREALFDLLESVEDDHWFWDTEVLVRAQRAGYRVREFPVTWTPKGDSKVDLVRDVLGMGSQIVRTWWQLSVSPRITRKVSLTAGTLLVVLALALMTVYLDPGTVLDRIGQADPRYVAAAAVLYAVSWPLRGARYRDILDRIGYRERLGFLTGAVFISQTGNLVFPARAGDAVRAYVVKSRRDIPYPSGFASLAVERVFDLLTITGLAGVVLLGLAATGNLGDLGMVLNGGVVGGDEAQSGRTAIGVASVVGATAIAAVGVIVLSARSERNFVRAAIGRVSEDSYADYLASVVEGFVGDVQLVAADRGAFSRIGLSSLLIWTLDVLTALLVLVAFGVALAPVALLAISFFAVSVGNLAKVLPLSPGGIGLYEGAFTLLVVALAPAGAVTVVTALSAAIVDHAVKNAVTILGGIGSMAWLNVSLTQAVEETSDVEPATQD